MNNCPLCHRPIWDGGHALNDRECSASGDLLCLAIKALQEPLTSPTRTVVLVQTGLYEEGSARGRFSTSSKER